MKTDRKPAEVERDRRNIASLYLQGKVQAEIAVELKISQSTVSRDLKQIVEGWKEERVYDINEAKARELAKIDNLEMVYWKAWERSLKDIVKTTKKAFQNDAPKGKGKEDDSIDYRQEQSQTVEGSAGEPRYLQGVMDCIKQRCAILGVEAPQKLKLSGEITPLPSNAEIRLAAIYADLQERKQKDEQ